MPRNAQAKTQSGGGEAFGNGKLVLHGRAVRRIVSTWRRLAAAGKASSAACRLPSPRVNNEKTRNSRSLPITPPCASATAPRLATHAHDHIARLRQRPRSRQMLPANMHGRNTSPPSASRIAAASAAMRRPVIGGSGSPLENDAGVGAAKTKTVGQRHVEFPRLRGVRDPVDYRLTARIIEVQSRWCNVIAHRQHGENRLHRAGAPSMCQSRIWSKTSPARARIAKQPFHRVQFQVVAERRGGPVGVT